MESRRARMLSMALLISGLAAACALAAALRAVAGLVRQSPTELAAADAAFMAAGGWSLVLLAAMLMVESLWRARRGGPVEPVLKPALISSAVLTLVGTSLALGGIS